MCTACENSVHKMVYYHPQSPTPNHQQPTTMWLTTNNYTLEQPVYSQTYPPPFSLIYLCYSQVIRTIHSTYYYKNERK